MPPKAKFTRKEIIAAAMQIVRERGVDAVTSRELGKRLGSSACPVFTVFANMEEVIAALMDAVKACYKEYIARGLKQELAFRGVGAAYIQFAIAEPKFFQLLFMAEQEQPTDIGHTLIRIDENYDEILRSVREPYGLSGEDAKRLYQHLWVYTHGIATLCATKVCTFTSTQIQTMMTEIFSSLLKEIKKKEVQKESAK